MFKKIILIIIFIVLLSTIFCIVDYNRVKNYKPPFFVITQRDEERAQMVYYGLGYKFVRSLDTFYKDDLSMDDYVNFGLWFYTWDIKKQIEVISIHSISNIIVIKSENCNNKPKLYYSEKNRNIYVYCLDDIIVSDKNNSMKLKQYIKEDINALNIIINNFTKEPEASYDDGGTKLYSGKDFNVLKCHTLDGNRDIYIGNKNMGYGRDFCNN